MSGDAHVRFWESAGVRFPRATHLPLYRLERIFERQRVHIARSTLAAWMAAAGELTRPLVELMKQRVKQSRVVHTDDTTVPIQSPGQKQCRKGRVWCHLGDHDHPYIVYDYTPSRARAGPAGWLAGYRGYLQADAYGGYDGIYASGGVTEVACWAHARRKFFEAKESDAKRAAQMLELIGRLESYSFVYTGGHGNCVGRRSRRI